MKYLNKATGVFVDFPCAVEGPDWELVEEKKTEPAPNTPKKAPARKASTTTKKRA